MPKGINKKIDYPGGNSLYKLRNRRKILFLKMVA